MGAAAARDRAGQGGVGLTEATRFLIGYEVGSGEPVEAVLHHLFISGVTQHSGKTTALEAFIERVQPRRTLVFRCGRGEIGFAGARRIPPYFRERTDWQFVEGVLSAHLHEKLRFYRGDLMRACRGAKTLKDVHANIRKRLDKLLERKGGEDTFVAKVLTELDQYFTDVLPKLDGIKFARALELHDGMNLIDLEGVPLPIQHLVITACATRIMESESNTILVIPEARQMIPEDQRTIVKLAVEDITARGAKIGNYVWLDSQHMTGVDLDILRNVDIRMYGRQTQDREYERVAKAIPGRRVTKDDVQGLLIGQFFVLRYGKEVQKVYVRPAWLPERVARDVALGKATLEDALKFKEESDVDDQEREEYERKMESFEIDLKRVTAERDQMHKSLGEANRKWEGLQIELKDLRGNFERYKAAFGPEPGIFLGKVTGPDPRGGGLEEWHGPTHGDLPEYRPPAPPAPLAPEAIERLKRDAAESVLQPKITPFPDEDEIRRIVRDELAKTDPVLLQVRREEPEIRVAVDRPVVQATDQDDRGRMAVLIHEGFFDEARAATETIREFVARAWRKGGGALNVAVYRELEWFSQKAFLRAEGNKGSRRWIAQGGARKRVKA